MKGKIAKRLNFKTISIIIIIAMLSIITTFIIMEFKTNNMEYNNHIDNNDFNVNYKYIFGFPEYSNKETIVSNEGNIGHRKHEIR